jgi:type I restriction enzyme S subunit
MDQNRLSQKGGNLLPEGWAETTLSEIATVNPKNGELNTLLSGFIPMALAPTDFNGHLEFEEREWDEIKKKYTHFANGDVIFAKVTPCFENGKAAIVNDLPNGIGAGSSEFYVLRPLDKGISASYIFANIKSHEFMQTGAENMTGAVGLRRVPRKFVEGFKVNLPPKAEQRVIADKLDTLLAQVETTKARLDRIPQILKTFCQSVLASANRGKLTEEWRDKNGLSISDWTFDKAQNLCTKVQSGSTPKNNPFDQDGKIPFLKVYNIVNQEINFDYKPQFITENVHSSSLSRSITHPNDILMNIVGPPLGKVAVVSSQYPEWNLNQAITLFRVNPEKLKFKYLYYVLCEGELVRKVMPDTKGSVGQINISLSQCRDAIIPAPKLVEQTEIVRRVEQLFAHADKIEQQVQAAQQRVDKLTQSILAKAFRGELTTQWRKDNPDLITGDNSAEALLTKIKAEREAKLPKKKAKTKKAKA